MLKKLCVVPVFVCMTLAAAQPGQQGKDITTIAKDANGAIVSIIMSDKDGQPVAQGSGFLVSKDGLVVTNYHVVKSGSSAVVKLPDGAFCVVDELLAFDERRDVAVLKAHGHDFRTVTLGDSDRVQVGQEVIAIGNPLSLESTVSNGMVSAIRTTEEEGGKILQITAPISPGSSGGPLFNMAGEVVGITTSHPKVGESLNFAIPINDVKSFLSVKFAKVFELPNDAEPSVPTSELALDDPSTLAETLNWMSNFSKHRGIAYSDSGEPLVITTEFSANGCSITLTQAWAEGHNVQVSETASLSSIDPESVTVHSWEKNRNYVDFETSDQSFGVRRERHTEADETQFTSSGQIAFGSPQDAARFAKALQHAIRLCGGKHLL